MVSDVPMDCTPSPLPSPTSTSPLPSSGSGDGDVGVGLADTGASGFLQSRPRGSSAHRGRQHPARATPAVASAARRGRRGRGQTSSPDPEPFPASRVGSGFIALYALAFMGTIAGAPSPAAGDLGLKVILWWGSSRPPRAWRW